MARLAKEHKTLKDDTSWLGKGKREKQMNELAKSYHSIKKDYEYAKERDFTMDAKEYIEKKAPEAHNKNKEAVATLNGQTSFKYGAREAQAGRQYTGEITAVNRFGVLQKTPTGRKIYHDLESFKDKLPHEGDQVTVSYDSDKNAEIATADRAELERQEQLAELERQNQNNDKGMSR